jgi:hypothetical protein
MTPTFAEADAATWATILGVATTVLGAIGTGAWKVISAFLHHLKEQDAARQAYDERRAEDRRQHDERMMARFEKISQDFRVEIQRVNDTQTDLHERTVSVLGEFGRQIGGLTVAVDKLQQGLDRKMDRPDHPKGGVA